MADKVLTDQMQSIITDLVRNFNAIAPNYTLNRASAIKSLNGDLRALLLVNTAKPDHLTPPLLVSLRILKERVLLANQLICLGKKVF